MGAQEWQPIETAPKDGRPILGFGICDGEVSGRGVEPAAAVVEWCGSWTVGATDYYGVTMEATHWMPLPDPPHM
jgi:hypothetical protein